MQAGNSEIEELGRGAGTEKRAISGDRQFGADRKQPAEFGARLVEAAEMGISASLHEYC